MGALKKQSVAWVVALVMIVAAIAVGQARKPSGAATGSAPAPTVSASPGGAPAAPASPAVTQAVPDTSSYICDEAGVLSDSTEKTLAQRNQKLLSQSNAVIAVVTTNYGKSDLGSYAIQYADNIGLGENDFIVVLDISGDNYWLVQGSGLVDRFTDDDCSTYAYSYMEQDFARGDYDSAVLSLTQALAQWYDAH
jgi:uncharacterized membrane protein YgcG